MTDAEDDLFDYEALPDDGGQAWLSLLRISLAVSVVSAALFGVSWIIQ